MQVSIFSNMVRAEFLRAMQVAAKPAEYQRFTQVIPTNARVEVFPWMYPAPGINKYEGHRRTATLDQINYQVGTYQFDGSFEVPLIDIEDDIAGGYVYRMRDLVIKAYEPFRSRWVFNTLKNGASTVCFDGSNFFATSHNLGGWGSTPAQFASGSANLLQFNTAAVSDGTTHVMIWLINEDEISLKPVLYLDRQSPQFRTSSGDNNSAWEQNVKYWIDLRAGFGFGYWWDAIMVNVAGTPTIPEMQSIIDGMRQVARGFYLPKNLVSDPTEFVHEQRNFGPDNTTVLSSSGLEWILNHVINEERIGISSNTFTNNIYRGFSHLIVSNILNP